MSAQIPQQLDGVSVRCKANVYFDGKVVSHTITFPDGSPFGPHAVELGVPVEYQYTEWAAAYEEIATAMAYIFGDTNQNGVEHEVALVPGGDVPGFFNWPAFHASVYDHYELVGNYSPHNDLIRAHVESLRLKVQGAKIDVYLALLLSEYGHHQLAAETWRRVRWSRSQGISNGTRGYYLGRALERLGKEDEAITALLEAAGSDATTVDDDGPRVAPAAQDRLADLGVRSN